MRRLNRQELSQATLRPLAQSARKAFTLIELLIVIVILSILIALVLPAVFGASETVRVSEVQFDIKALDSSISDFKAKYDFIPPSQITLYETGSDWNSDPGSRAVIRRMFPRYNFSGNVDINGDGDATDTLTLTGPECLVFFLGGLNANGAMNGFSESPSQPFTRGGSTRTQPFFDFKVDRLVDLDGDDMPEYVDTLPSQSTPYMYVSAYAGTYAPADMTIGSLSMTDVYRVAGAGSVAHNPSTYQIISPGPDGSYGEGGRFNPDTALQDFSARQFEQDNITNFHSGMLAR